MTSSPWASGPGEILRHGVSLLKKDSDVNRRLAMIAIDNAVELMVKTYLGLPKRVTGLQIGRERFREISESFPKLIDALEEHAADRLTGIDLGIIEWYHRLRNELYHQGNGLTVERDKVEVYAELAKLLFRNLFASELPVDEPQTMELLGYFMDAWARIERATIRLVKQANIDPRSFSCMNSIRNLNITRELDDSFTKELLDLGQLRNGIVHGALDLRTTLTEDLVSRANRAADRLEKLLIPTDP